MDTERTIPKPPREAVEGRKPTGKQFRRITDHRGAVTKRVIALRTLWQACHGFKLRILRPGLLLWLVAISAGTPEAHAQTWLLNPGSGDFDTPGNWTPATVPTGTATAMFGASNTTTITFSGVTIVGALQFNAGAPAYTFDISSSAFLLMIGAGFVNNSSNRPTFNNIGPGGGEIGGIFFENSSTAGNAIIINHEDSGGFAAFLDSSSAGNATIIGTGFGLGGTFFENTSNGGNATIIASSGAITEFIDSSTAFNATLITNSGGFTIFEGTATGGDARVITNPGGIFDISLTALSGITVGSIEAAGTYFLGSKVLTVGLNNLSTEVGGTIEDGGFSGATGGSLVKVGTGTLTLSGTNTYTGGTTISAGTLQIGNGGTSGSILGNVVDNAALVFDRSDAFTFSGLISGTGTVTQAGTGTLILTGNSTYSGGTTISGGTLQIGNGGTAGSITGNVVDNAALVFDRSNAFTFGGSISGPGTVTQAGSGTLTLAGNNTYTGATNVALGTLQAGSSTAFSANSAFTVTSVLDLNGFNNTIGSLSGNGTVTNTGATTATLTVGNNKTNTTFGGVLEDGTGVLGLVKVGSGTLILTGANTYSGGTTISGGTLQIGNGGTAGSITGNVVDNAALVFDRSNAFTFGGSISGPGTVTQAGSGTLTLAGNNTYSGGTTISAGTLIVDSALALGVGNVTVNGGVLTADPQPINVKGNYVQGPNGTLRLTIAGANPGQYDSLNVTGNATLGGTLQLVNQNFQPKAGEKLTLVTTGGTVNGTFSQFIDPFSSGPGFNFVDLVYNRQSVVLEFLFGLTSFARTPNQLAAAELIDAVAEDPRGSNLIAFFSSLPPSEIPAELDIFSPESLTSFYEISFSAANIQRLTLENRLDAVRASSGSITDGSGGGTVGLEKTVDDGKTSKNPPVLQPAPQPRFDLWAVGFGDFVNLDSDFNAKGYRFTTGGFDLGFDYRFLNHFVIGVMGSYAHTWTDLQPGSVTVNTGRGGLYASYFTGEPQAGENTGSFYVDAGIYGGHNTYDSSRQGLGGNATGSTDGNEWSGFISGGYDFHRCNLTIGPIASLQYTNVNISGFNETGSLAPLSIHSDSEESLRSDLGFRAFYQWQVGGLLLAPYLTAAWEHEFKYSALPITAGLADIPGPNETFFGPAEGHDSLVLTAGLSVQWTPMVSTYVAYDGQLGRGQYSSNAVTGGVRVSW